MISEDVGGTDRLAEVAGAEERDVLLRTGLKNLANFVGERIDVVSNAALAELAEAREITANLRAVNARVLRELLRRERLTARLLCLRQDLEIAREACSDAQRKLSRAVIRCDQTNRSAFSLAACHRCDATALSPRAGDFLDREG